MTESLILVDQAAAVTTLTLNRPAAMNSFTTAMHTQFLLALDRIADDPSARCVILTGAGRGFCAGQDLTDPAAAPGKDLGELLERYFLPLIERLRAMPVPVLAAVNGVAAGAGANLALGCDLVVAGRSASFIQAFSKIGLVPDAGGTWLLLRLVGHARALGLAMLGDKVPAADAAQMGLIWQCVDDAALTDTVAALATRLAAMPSKALVATRHAIAAAESMDLPSALAEEVRLQRSLGIAHDYREGVEAFRARRPARFSDR